MKLELNCGLDDMWQTIYMARQMINARSNTGWDDWTKVYGNIESFAKALLNWQDKQEAFNDLVEKMKKESVVHDVGDVPVDGCTCHWCKEARARPLPSACDMTGTCQCRLCQEERMHRQ